MKDELQMTEADREGIKAADKDYEEYEVLEVQLDRDAPGKGDWVCTLEHGFHLRFPREKGNKQPKAGQTARIYGDLDEGGMRGLDLDAEGVFYRTPDEQVVHLTKLEWQMREDAKTHLTDLDKRVEALPAPIRAVLTPYREADGFDALRYLNAVGVVEQGYYLSLVVQDAFAVEVFASLASRAKRASVFRQMIDDAKKRAEDDGDAAKLKELARAEKDQHWFDMPADENFAEILQFARGLVESEEPLALTADDGVVTVQSADDMLK